MIDSRRREERITAKLPIRVWGMDANGKPFSQATTTLDVTRTGARLAGLQCPLQQGETIGIQHRNDKARFRVAWVGRVGTARAGQIGVLCVEPDKYIWGTPLNELRSKSQAEPARAPGPSFVAPLPPERPAAKATSERRDSTRYVCTGGAEFKKAEGGFKNWGTVADVSHTGCYVETNFPLAARTLLDLQINVRNIDIRARAVVRSAHPNVGMGLEFAQISPEDRHRLETLISMLTIVPGALQRSATTAPQASVPAPAAPVASSTVPQPKESSSSDHILRTITELRDAEAIIETSALLIEPRALAEFLRAIDHVRQTTVSTQNWLQNTGGSDSSKLVEERNSARARTITSLARELTVDIDGRSFDLGSEGFEELLTAITQLHDRLMSLTDANNDDDPVSPS